jgi:curved DNA-binding protein CbpA
MHTDCRPPRSFGESLAPMSTVIDHYAVLGVRRGASSDEIRTAYRRAARASHPDLHPGDATAHDRFKQVQVAYEVLGDPARRAAYDAPVVQPVARTVSAYHAEEPVSLARELGETVRSIRVMARRSGFARRVNRLIRYLEHL